jgi:hypothetical protein
MALWGNRDNIPSNGGRVWLNYTTGIVTATGTNFGSVGSASTGDVIRFGSVSGTYFGDAVIVGITSARQLRIDSTAGLSGAAIANTSFSISQLPKFTTLDNEFSQTHTNYEPYVAGVSTAGINAAQNTVYSPSHAGWVGIKTYVDADGKYRVKTEVLVAMSGIQTGNTPLYDANPLV